MSQDKPKKRQFNVYLPPELVKALKHHAIDRGMHMSPLVEEIFRDYLQRQAEQVDPSPE